MVVSKNGNSIGPRDPALAGSRPADQHSGQPFFAATYGDEGEDPQRLEEENDLKDSTKIHLGMLTGKAMLSAAGEMQRQDERHKVEVKAKRDARAAQDAKELANLAQWNKQTTTMGGVQMTNEQAQAARRNFIEHEDEMARRAVERGYIKPGQEDEAKVKMRRRYELSDKEGRGTATDEEKRENKRLANDPLLQGVERMAAEQHRDHKVGASMESSTRSPATLATSSTMPEARMDGYFDVPSAKGHFAAASVPKTPESNNVPALAPAPISRKLESSGLGC